MWEATLAPATGVCGSLPALGADHHSTGLRLDPNGDEAPQARDAADVVGGVSSIVLVTEKDKKIATLRQGRRTRHCIKNKIS
jgi:hypothetical protein